MYGDATITLKDGKLFMQFLPSPKFNATLNHWENNTFEFEFKEFPSLPRGTVTFNLNSLNKVESMLVDVPNPDFDFTELEFNRKD